ncbi:uncharacterized protein UTRI_02317 [Ustilago trichophora]|uniref:Uncharacterized protein n=1 Tax=Ustilago trichophora TaxID=86804 RepID=A0A5C3E5S0_9BASI|nr:uncharacterized protein UTRI_02317 [Ustilago trichophora]
MTDNEPRQLLPESESHQNLSTKLSASRPLPPRSRNNKSATSHTAQQNRSATSSVIDSNVGIDPKKQHELPLSHDSQMTAKSQGEDEDEDEEKDQADLEARGTASPVRMSAQRAVSSSSIRSTRSNDMPSDIPKEEIERALEGLGRDDLVVALGRAKVQMDEIEAQLDQQVLENETLHDSAASLTQQLGQSEAQVHNLQTLVKQREERIDEIMAEQERMEGEVYSTMQIIERLRKQLSETERSRNDAEKRYLDQMATMDKERQYYMDTEALLKSQKATQAVAYEKLLSGHNELLREHERLTNRLASIKASGSMPDVESPFETARDLTTDQGSVSQDSHASALADDDDQKADSSAADDAIHSRQARKGAAKASTFAQERDMAALIEELSTLQKSHYSLSETMVTLQTELKDVRAENVALRDQNETFMDILQEKTFSGALLNESAMLRGIRRASLGRLHAQNGLEDPYDDEYSTEADSLDIDDEDEDDEGDRTGGTSISSGTIPEEDEDDVDDVPDTPKAPPKQVKGSRRRRSSSNAHLHATTDLASELQDTSNNSLASPADRIGRENRSSQRIGVVSDSVDELQTEVRELREANQALTLYISKIIDRIIAREGYENILAVESRGTIRGPRHKASRARLGQSPNHNKANSEDKAGSRNSKRTSSIDWRNLPFLGGGGSSSAGNAPEPSSSLRPLTLQSDSLRIPPREGTARKLRTSEEIEDEHDVAERERIRQELLMRGIKPPKHQLVQSPTSPRKQRPQSISTAPGAGGFAAFFSRVVGGASSNTVMSPGRSDSQSQASTTPGRSTDTVFDRPSSSTPAMDSGKRDEERTRALQLSAGGGNSLTKLSGGQGIASRARQLRAERHQQTLDLAADSNPGYPFPSSSQSSSTNSRATSGSNSLADSSFLENSIAGDESYSLPAPTGATQLQGESDGFDSPLAGYGGTLPPLPHETTGDEDPQAFRSPTLAQNKSGSQNNSQDQGWKRAFRRISLLSTTSSGSPTQEVGEHSAAASPVDAPRSSPLAAPVSLSSTEMDADNDAGWMNYTQQHSC